MSVIKRLLVVGGAVGGLWLRNGLCCANRLLRGIFTESGDKFWVEIGQW